MRQSQTDFNQPMRIQRADNSKRLIYHLPAHVGADGVSALGERMARAFASALVNILANAPNFDEADLTVAHVFAWSSVDAVHVLATGLFLLAFIDREALDSAFAAVAILAVALVRARGVDAVGVFVTLISERLDLTLVDVHALISVDQFITLLALAWRKRRYKRDKIRD